MHRSIKHNRGFTLIELLVCITIFVIMTALLVVKYGNFNQSVLATNIAYSAALAIRTAQNYGLSVKGTSPGASCGSSSFQCEYGVEFNTASNNSFFLFAHNPDPYGTFKTGDQKVTTYTLKNGAIISAICADTSGLCVSGATSLDVLFQRPDPNALICASGTCPSTPYSYARITIKATDGSTRSISVRSNGQISVDI